MDDIRKIANECFAEYYDSNKDSNKVALEIIQNLLKAIVHNKFQGVEICCRLKTKEECLTKFERKYLEKLTNDNKENIIKESITDLFGFRIVCLYEEEIEKIALLLKENFDLKDETNKTEELKKNDSFGYKGLHLDLCLREDRTNLPEYTLLKDLQFEVQIRSIIQNAWSVLDHKIKYKKSISVDLQRQIVALSALFEIADREFSQIAQKTKKVEEDAVAASDSILTPYILLNFLQNKYSLYRFSKDNRNIDSITETLIEQKISMARISESFEEIQKDVVQYKKDKDIFMNPITEFRHILYKLSKETLKNILFDSQRNAFDEWCKEKK